MENVLDSGPQYASDSCSLDDYETLRAGVGSRAGNATPPSSRSADPGSRPRVDPFVGKKISHYTIKALIGRGGMGAVYLAEQSVPVQRAVALKLLHANAGGEESIQRFLAERQALAMMNHTDIAQVYDAGRTEDGHYYFAMELVEGQPLDKFCDQQQLSVHERLVLVHRLCEAIEHAHQRGVLHRDIKPANVIASRMGNQTKLKVIDFGIAKALRANSIAHAAAETQVGQVIGTPAYMSPEQAGLRNEVIDQRSDVYSIGVLLYKLLTGTTPLESEKLQGKSLSSVLQQISHVDAERPSSRIRRLDNTARTELAKKLSTVATMHHQLLRSELDWLVLKAIHLDRKSRYSSAEELGTDIRRYLDNQPITAISSSYGYHVRKFYRRHRAACLTAMVVAIATMASLLTYSQYHFEQQAAKAAMRRKLDSLATSISQRRDILPSSMADTMLLWNEVEQQMLSVTALTEQVGVDASSRAFATNLNIQFATDREHLETLQRCHESSNRRSIFHGGTKTLDHPSSADSDLTELAEHAESYPRLFQPIVLESLALQMARCVRGVGLDIGRDTKGYYVKAVYEDGAASHSGVTPGQRLLGLPQLTDEMGAELSDLSSVDVATYLHGPPASEREIVIQSGKTITRLPLTCGGQESRTLLERMNRIDQDPWRTRLRSAVHTSDELPLRRLASDPELLRQPLHSYILLAVGLRQLSLHDEKLHVLRQAQSRFPQRALSHLALAEALALESNPRRLQEAARHLTATIAVDTHNLAAQFLLARVLQEQQKPNEAKRQYEQIISHHPEAVVPQAYYVTFLQSEGRDTEAREAYRTMVARHGERERLASLVRAVHLQQRRRSRMDALERKVLEQLNSELLRGSNSQVPLPDAGKLKSQMGDLIRALGR